MPQTPATTPRSTYPGLLLISAATLLLEVTLTRVLSATLWHHFAFMVVSTALFGLGGAGVALSFRRHAAEVPARWIAGAGVVAPLAFALGFWALNTVPFEPFALGTDAVQWLYLALAYLAAALPFLAAGVAIAATLTRHATAVHQLYLFDLVGAGLGSVAIVLSLPSFGAGATIALAAALAGFGGGLLALEHSRRAAGAAAALGVALLLAAPVAEDLVPIRISTQKTVGGIAATELVADPKHHRRTFWDLDARVDLVAVEDGRGNEQQFILLDAGAALTRVARPERALDQLGPTGDEEGFFVARHPGADVLVVGSGGGREVLLALRNGAAAVTAVEINGSINELVTHDLAELNRGLFSDPRVTLHTDEARSFIRRSSATWDVIHCPHTISNAALVSGSLSLSENYLLTREAFDDYLAHLSEDGVLVMTRPEAHVPRAIVTARAALEAAGVEHPGDAIMAWRGLPGRGQKLSFYAGIAVARRPFSKAEVDQFARVLKDRRLQPLYLPRIVTDGPYFQVAAGSGHEKPEFPFPTLLYPATDDRPFFNQRVSWSQLSASDVLSVFGVGREGRTAMEDRPVAESALFVLLVESGVLAGAFVLLPLWWFRRRGLGGAYRVRTLLAFGGIGLGYVIVEVGFIQRLGLHLGRPVLTFAVVLATLLIASGIGSGLSSRLRTPWAARQACVAIVVIAGLVTALAPTLLAATLGWSLAGRVAVAVALMIPAGLLMGTPFPLLVRQLEASFPERIPWAWGVNGFASVVGSIVAVLVGMSAGYTAVLFVGVGCYAIAAGAAWRAPGAPEANA